MGAGLATTSSPCRPSCATPPTTTAAASASSGAIVSTSPWKRAAPRSKTTTRRPLSGTNYGDNPAPLLGQTLVLNSLQQAYGIRGSSIYSKALATASPFSWLNFYGQFLYSEPKTTVNYTDSATGNFALIGSLLFYSGQQNLGTGAANQPHTSGNAGFELRPFRRLRIVESWMTDRYHDAASPLTAEQILLTPKTLGPDLITAPNYTQTVNYNQQQTDVLFDLTSKLTLRGGYRYVWGDATVSPGSSASRALWPRAS